MSSAKQNRSIARLIVGAMSIDGVLDKTERDKVAHALGMLGMGELIADVGVAIEADPGDFNMFAECQDLVDTLGTLAPDVTPLIFRIVADVVASDQFVSAQEAGYLSSMAKKLGLTAALAKSIFQQVLAERRSRIEISGKSVDQAISPYLKEMLSFTGADYILGRGVVEEQAEEDFAESDESITDEDLSRALTVLGLETGARLKQAEQVWRETIDHLELPKMADLGETFVSAAINRLTRINEAYKIVLRKYRRAS